MNLLILLLLNRGKKNLQREKRKSKKKYLRSVPGVERENRFQIFQSISEILMAGQMSANPAG